MEREAQREKRQAAAAVEMQRPSTSGGRPKPPRMRQLDAFGIEADGAMEASRLARRSDSSGTSAALRGRGGEGPGTRLEKTRVSSARSDKTRLEPSLSEKGKGEVRAGGKSVRNSLSSDFGLSWSQLGVQVEREDESNGTSQRLRESAREQRGQRELRDQREQQEESLRPATSGGRRSKKAPSMKEPRTYGYSRDLDAQGEGTVLPDWLVGSAAAAVPPRPMTSGGGRSNRLRARDSHGEASEQFPSGGPDSLTSRVSRLASSLGGSVGPPGSVRRNPRRKDAEETGSDDLTPSVGGSSSARRSSRRGEGEDAGSGTGEASRRSGKGRVKDLREDTSRSYGVVAEQKEEEEAEELGLSPNSREKVNAISSWVESTVGLATQGVFESGDSWMPEEEVGRGRRKKEGITSGETEQKALLRKPREGVDGREGGRVKEERLGRGLGSMKERGTTSSSRMRDRSLWMDSADEDEEGDEPLKKDDGEVLILGGHEEEEDEEGMQNMKGFKGKGGGEVNVWKMEDGVEGEEEEDVLEEYDDYGHVVEEGVVGKGRASFDPHVRNDDIGRESERGGSGRRLSSSGSISSRGEGSISGHRPGGSSRMANGYADRQQQQQQQQQQQSSQRRPNRSLSTTAAGNSSDANMAAPRRRPAGSSSLSGPLKLPPGRQSAGHMGRESSYGDGADRQAPDADASTGGTSRPRGSRIAAWLDESAAVTDWPPPHSRLRPKTPSGDELAANDRPIASRPSLQMRPQTADPGGRRLRSISEGPHSFGNVGGPVPPLVPRSSSSQAGAGRGRGGVHRSGAPNVGKGGGERHGRGGEEGSRERVRTVHLGVGRDSEAEDEEEEEGVVYDDDGERPWGGSGGVDRGGEAQGWWRAEEDEDKSSEAERMRRQKEEQVDRQWEEEEAAVEVEEAVARSVRSTSAQGARKSSTGHRRKESWDKGSEGRKSAAGSTVASSANQQLLDELQREREERKRLEEALRRLEKEAEDKEKKKAEMERRKAEKDRLVQEVASLKLPGSRLGSFLSQGHLPSPGKNVEASLPPAIEGTGEPSIQTKSAAGEMKSEAAKSPKTPKSGRGTGLGGLLSAFVRPRTPPTLSMAERFTSASSKAAPSDSSADVSKESHLPSAKSEKLPQRNREEGEEAVSRKPEKSVVSSSNAAASMAAALVRPVTPESLRARLTRKNREVIRAARKDPSPAPQDGQLGGNILGKPYSDVHEAMRLERDELGRGRFGVIRACIDRKTGERLACKSISKSMLQCAQDVEDVRREVMVMEMLRGHRNIISLISTFEDPQDVHLVMELCEGGELFDRIKAKGRYSERDSACIVRTVVEVLKHCHDAGVMHRDLKPENILLVTRDSDVDLKVIDFGVATFFQKGKPCTDMAGSPYYLAPEVLAEKYGPEADIWSAGVVLYILLSGLPPFWAPTNEGIFQAIRDSSLNMLRNPWPIISDEAKDLVQRMLMKNPRKRIGIDDILNHPWVSMHTTGM